MRGNSNSTIRGCKKRQRNGNSEAGGTEIKGIAIQIEGIRKSRRILSSRKPKKGKDEERKKKKKKTRRRRVEKSRNAKKGRRDIAFFPAKRHGEIASGKFHRSGQVIEVSRSGKQSRRTWLPGQKERTAWRN